ncbi:unnamed protein product [Allacma fusca]|uniref:Cystatin domain-containing protein n=1 Tax=Allacma fusca TaxID=39272 RepID=A0A8J2NWB0_9HEXA|nr:unnamed protein product [Allacma fusca]
MPLLAGGLGALKEADERVREVVGKVESEIRSQLSEKLGAVNGPIEPIGYKTQVVAGTNYFIKLLVDEKIVHARVYRSLQGEVSLHSVTEEKAAEEEVRYKFFSLSYNFYIKQLPKSWKNLVPAILKVGIGELCYLPIAANSQSPATQ